MIDPEIFSEDNFDSVNFINNLINNVYLDETNLPSSTFSSLEKNEKLISFLTTTELKLNDLSNSLSEDLESAMKDSVHHSIPKLVSSSQSLTESLTTVQNQLENITSQINSISNFQSNNLENKENTEEKESSSSTTSSSSLSSSIEEISRLDHYKTNMLNVTEILTQHSLWKHHVSEAYNLIQSPSASLTEKANSLISLSSSITTLKSLVNHEKRLEIYEDIKGIILNLIKNEIKMNIKNKNLTKLNEYYYVYDKLNCLNLYENEFFYNFLENFFILWENYYQNFLCYVSSTDSSTSTTVAPSSASDFNSSSSESSSNSFSPSTFSEWFASFNGKILNFLMEEEELIINLFGIKNRKKNLLKILKLIYEKINQNLSEIFSKISENSLLIYEIYLILKEFSRRFLQFFFDSTPSSNRITDSSIDSSSTISASLSITDSVSSSASSSDFSENLFEILDLIFYSFNNCYKIYLNSEDHLFKNKINEFISSINFISTSSSNSSELSDLGNEITIQVNDIQDPNLLQTSTPISSSSSYSLSLSVHSLTNYLNNMKINLKNFFQYYLEMSKRCYEIYGGIFYNNEIKNLILNNINYFLTLFLLKINIIYKSLGYNNNITSLSSTSPLSSYPSYAQELSIANSISTKILTSEENKLEIINYIFVILELLSQLRREMMTIHSYQEKLEEKLLQNYLKYEENSQNNTLNQWLLQLKNYFLDPSSVSSNLDTISLSSFYGLYLLNNDKSLSKEIKDNLLSKKMGLLDINYGLDFNFIISYSSNSTSSDLSLELSSTFQKITLSCGEIVFNYFLELPLKLLTQYNTDDLWTSSLSSSITSSLPSSLYFTSTTQDILPHHTITPIGEKLLNLLNEVENFSLHQSTHDLLALRNCFRTLPFYFNGWKDLVSLISPSSEASTINNKDIIQLLSRSSCINLILLFDRQINTNEEKEIDPSSYLLEDYEKEDLILPSTYSLSSYYNFKSNIELILSSGSSSGPSSNSSSSPSTLNEQSDEDIRIQFVSEFFIILTDIIFGLYLKELLLIRNNNKKETKIKKLDHEIKLNERGYEQILKDFEYIYTVIDAISIKYHPLLFHLFNRLKNMKQEANIINDIKQGN